MEELQTYLNKRTLIYGDVNSGKTARTLEILKVFIRTGYSEKIAVIDMAPDPIGGLGGKLKPPTDTALLYLTTNIAAPRLAGRDEADSLRLAVQNAREIEALFALLRRQPRDILFINDASLYLQAGRPDRFLAMLQTASTQIINAYYGSAFADSALTRRERRQLEALTKTCDVCQRL